MITDVGRRLINYLLAHGRLHLQGQSRCDSLSRLNENLLFSSIRGSTKLVEGGAALRSPLIPEGRLLHFQEPECTMGRAAEQVVRDPAWAAEPQSLFSV